MNWVHKMWNNVIPLFRAIYLSSARYLPILPFTIALLEQKSVVYVQGQNRRSDKILSRWCIDNTPSDKSVPFVFDLSNISPILSLIYEQEDEKMLLSCLRKALKNLCILQPRHSIFTDSHIPSF